MSQDSSSSLKTPLKVFCGSGNARLWWAQRATALVLVFSGLWFVWHFVPQVRHGYHALVHFLKSPLEAVLLILLVITSVYHGYLGLQVIIEDYLHSDFLKNFFLLSVRALAVILSVWGILSILIIQF